MEEPAVYFMNDMEKGMEDGEGTETETKCEIQFPSGVVPGAPVTHCRIIYTDYEGHGGWANDERTVSSIELSTGRVKSLADSMVVLELEQCIVGNATSSYSGNNEPTYKVVPHKELTLKLEHKCRQESNKSTILHREYFKKEKVQKFFDKAFGEGQFRETFDEAFAPRSAVVVASFDVSDGVLRITARRPLSGEEFVVEVPATRDGGDRGPRVEEVVPEIRRAGGYLADSILQLVLPDGAILKEKDEWPASSPC